MKRRIIALAIILVIVLLSACNRGGENTPAPAKFDTEAAIELTENYLRLITEGNYEEAKKLCTEDLQGDSENMQKEGLKIVSYNQDDLNEVGASVVATYRINRIASNEPRADLDICTITIVKEGEEYKISKVNAATEKEAYAEGRTLRQRKEEDVESDPIIRLHRLPQDMYIQGKEASLNKVSIPNEKFTTVNYNYAGDSIAISTYDGDSYVAIIKLDDSIGTAGGVTSGSGGGGGGGGGKEAGSNAEDNTGNEGSSEEDLSTEEPVGKEITSLEVFPTTSIEVLAFSRDEEYLMVQYTEVGKGSSIKLYKVQEGEAADLPLQDNYPNSQYSTSFVRFDKGKMIFKVEALAPGTGDSNITGQYQVDLEKLSTTKI